MSRDFTLGEKDDCSNSLHLPRLLAESFSFQVFLLEGKTLPGDPSTKSRCPSIHDSDRSASFLPSAAAAAMPDFVTRVEGTEKDHITEEMIAESCDKLCDNNWIWIARLCKLAQFETLTVVLCEPLSKGYEHPCTRQFVPPHRGRTMVMLVMVGWADPISPPVWYEIAAQMVF